MSKQESVEQMIDALNLELDKTELEYDQAMQRLSTLAEKSGIDIADLQTKTDAKGADFSGTIGKLLGIYAAVQTLKKQTNTPSNDSNGR